MFASTPEKFRVHDSHLTVGVVHPKAQQSGSEAFNLHVPFVGHAKEPIAALKWIFGEQGKRTKKKLAVFFRTALSTRITGAAAA
jgi:hypothetical protein